MGRGLKPAFVNFESGGLLCPFPLGGAGFPCNTVWCGPWPTSMTSFMIHPTVWPQYTNVTDRQDRHVKIRFTNGRPKTLCEGHHPQQRIIAAYEASGR